MEKHRASPEFKNEVEASIHEVSFHSFDDKPAESSAFVKKKKEPVDPETQAKARVLLKKYLCGNFWVMFSGVFINIFSLAGELAGPGFIGYIIQAITVQDYDEAQRLAIIWFIFNAAVSVFSYFQSFIFGYVSARVGRDMR